MILIADRVRGSEGALAGKDIEDIVQEFAEAERKWGADHEREILSETFERIEADKEALANRGRLLEAELEQRDAAYKRALAEKAEAINLLQDQEAEWERDRNRRVETLVSEVNRSVVKRRRRLRLGLIIGAVLVVAASFWKEIAVLFGYDTGASGTFAIASKYALLICASLPIVAAFLDQVFRALDRPRPIDGLFVERWARARLTRLASERELSDALPGFPYPIINYQDGRLSVG